MDNKVKQFFYNHKFDMYNTKTLIKFSMKYGFEGKGIYSQALEHFQAEFNETTWEDIKDYFSFYLDTNEEMQRVISVLKDCKDIVEKENKVSSMYLKGAMEDYDKITKKRQKVASSTNKKRHTTTWIRQRNEEMIMKHYNVSQEDAIKIINNDVNYTYIENLTKEDKELIKQSHNEIKQ